MQLELYLARDIKKSKKGSYRYINQKRMVKERYTLDEQQCRASNNG